MRRPNPKCVRIRRVHRVLKKIIFSLPWISCPIWKEPLQDDPSWGLLLFPRAVCLHSWELPLSLWKWCLLSSKRPSPTLAGTWLMHDTCQVIWKPNYFKYDWLERFSKDCSQGIQSVLLNSCFAIRLYPHEISAFRSISQKSPKSHQSLLLRWITVMFWWNLSCLSAGWPCRRRLCAAIFWETNKSHHFASSLPSSVETRSPYWSIKRRSS